MLAAVGTIIIGVWSLYQLEKRKKRLQKERRQMRSIALYLESQARGGEWR